MTDKATPPRAGADGVMELADDLTAKTVSWHVIDRQEEARTVSQGSSFPFFEAKKQARAALETAVRSTFARLAAAEAERDALRAEAADLRDTVDDLARQFAYPTVAQGVTSLTTGGLSALEGAFAVLGWEDPRPCPEGSCEHPGCVQWATCGTPTSDGYKRLCHKHYAALAPAGAGEGTG